MRPRLLILTPDFPPSVGGIQSLLSEVSACLSGDWDVTVVAPKSTGGAVEQPVASVRVLRTHLAWGGAGSAGVLAEMAALGRFVRPDLVLAGHLLAMPSALAAAGSKPAAALLYGSELWSPRGIRVMKTAGRRFRLLIAISRFTAAQAAGLGVSNARLRIAPPGARLPSPPPDADERRARYGLAPTDGGPGDPYFLTVGRLAEPHKGHDVFIRSMPALLSRFPNLKYVIAGDGPLRSYLQGVASIAGVDRSVLTIGPVDDLTKSALLARCCAFVMLSREAPAAAQFEGFGIAYLEAALAGRPSVGGDSGGVPDAVVHDGTGLLVDPVSVPHVVEAARTLLEQPALADGLGEAGRRRAERDFSWPVAAGRMSRLLHGILR